MLCLASPAFAQGKPAPPTKPAPPRPAAAQAPADPIGIRGFVTFGNFSATARESFEAVLGSNSGPIFGGGAHVLLPRGIYVEVAASRFSRDGERVFVAGDDIFPLGIPVEVTLTPLEFTGGWRYRHCPRTPKTRSLPCRPTIVPYVGGGLSSYRYQETSDFADEDENVDDRFNGFHILGGVEYLPVRWMAIGGEVAWSSIADAIGEGGVSAAFNEDNLGGTTIRLKISFGR
jgi:hypothetical protein